MRNTIERHFIWIIILFASIALFFPTLFINLKSTIPLGLGLIMFGIGINTSLSSFTINLANPKSLVGLILLRFTLMPLCALVISAILNLDQAESIGLVILGTAPSGTASNVMAYLAKANSALAVILTFGTTLLSPLLTPILIYFYLHQSVAIQFWPMVYHISSIIFLPILAGLTLNYYKISFIEKIKNFLPPVSIFFVAIIIASIFALNRQVLFTFPMKLIIAVTLLNCFGYSMGALTALLTKQEKSSLLAITYDYGMFDAVVAIVICTTFFSPQTAIPAVLMSIIQNLTASLILKYCSSNYAVARLNHIQSS